MFPANMSVAPNSPIARAQVIIVPVMIARIVSGKETVKKTLKRESDKIFALLTTSRSMFSNPVFADLKRNGDATKTSAIITAIVYPGITNPNIFSKGPNSPFGAKAKSRATPATAGGRTNGKSITVSITALPGNFLVAIK